MGAELAGCAREETETQVSWSDSLHATPGKARVVGTKQIVLAGIALIMAFVVRLL